MISNGSQVDIKSAVESYQKYVSSISMCFLSEYKTAAPILCITGAQTAFALVSAPLQSKLFHHKPDLHQ